MALSQSWPGVSGKAQALDVRRDLAGMVVRAGVMPMADMTTPLMTKTSTMIPQVKEFHAAVRRANVQDGVQLIHNDGPTGTFPQFDAAPQTGTRLDLLYVRVYDTAFDSKASVEFEKITGTATTGIAQARRDLLPAGAVELGTVLFPAGATTLNSSGVVYTDTYQFGALRGGAIWFRDVADMTDADAALHPMGASGRLRSTGEQYSVVMFKGVKRWIADTSYQEFTTIANGVPGGENHMGSVIEVTSTAQNNSGDKKMIESGGTNGTILLQPGKYIIEVQVNIQVVDPGRCYIAGAWLDNGTVALHRNPWNNDNICGVSGVVAVVGAPRSLQMRVYKSSSGATNHSGLITVTRVS